MHQQLGYVCETVIWVGVSGAGACFVERDGERDAVPWPVSSFEVARGVVDAEWRGAGWSVTRSVETRVALFEGDELEFGEDARWFCARAAERGELESLVVAVEWGREDEERFARFDEGEGGGVECGGGGGAVGGDMGVEEDFDPVTVAVVVVRFEERSVGVAAGCVHDIED